MFSLTPSCHICYTLRMNQDKPTFMTLLTGKQYVCKTHPRIVLRGAIDSFIAEILLVIADARKTETPNGPYLTQLQSLLAFLKQVQYAEAADCPLKDIHIIGLDADALREQSHHPQHYFGIGHLFDLQPEYDERVLHMNYLRAKSRELEIIAVAAYEEEDTPAHNSILTALNRLSSALYIMELRIQSKRLTEED